MNKISILDYGTSNLLNVARAVGHIGFEVELIKTPEEIKKADRLILPGVGAFSDAMERLKENGLDEALIDYARNTQRPFLGICLGMQMLMDTSHEFGSFKGLGIIRGEVVRIPELNVSGEPRRVPHVGWSALTINNNVECSVITPDFHDSSMYFVHSYMVVPANPDVITATTSYQNLIITASLKQDNVVAAQFHPERSAKMGLEILKNFANI